MKTNCLTMNLLSHIDLLDLPDDNLDQILNNLTFNDLLNCKLVCKSFDSSIKRILASITVLEDTDDSIKLVFTLLPHLKNVHVIKHYSIGRNDDDHNQLVLDLLSTYCRKITYFQYSPVDFVYQYIMQLEEQNYPVFISKIKIANSYDWNSKDLDILINKYPSIELFIDELDLQSLFDDTWSDDDHLRLQKITGLNPGMLLLNSSTNIVDKLLSSLSSLRSLWIKVSINDVHLICTHCTRLKYLYIEDIELVESPDLNQIETLIQDKVSSYKSFSLNITSNISIDKLKQLLHLLMKSNAKFHYYSTSEWLSCDLRLGNNVDIWTKEQIVYIKFWPLESLIPMLYLFLPIKKIQVEQQVSLSLKDTWIHEIEIVTKKLKVKTPHISFVPR